MRHRSGIILLPSLLLIGCATGEPGLAGGSSDQGNALELKLVSTEGPVPSGVAVELHDRRWIQGSSVDPSGQTLLTDSSGRVLIASPEGMRLLVRHGSLGTWADLDSLDPNHDTLALEPTSTIAGRITDFKPGTYLAIPGTSLSIPLDDSGKFQLTVPTGLGSVSLVEGSGRISNLEVPTPSGSFTSLAPIPAGSAEEAPVLGLSSEWLPVSLTMRTARLLRSQNTSFLRIVPGDWVTLGPVIPDSTAQGTVRFSFRPGPEFHRDSAWTILGDQGGRLHIAFLKGTLFFQKGQDNLHRVVTSTPGQLPSNRWYRFAATWGPLGMSLSIDGKPVAWSSDSTGYLRDTRTDTGFHISIGHKEYCCMDVLRIVRPLQGSGDYADIEFLRRQIDAWGDGTPRKCPDSSPDDILPRCAVQGAVRVTDPLW